MGPHWLFSGCFGSVCSHLEFKKYLPEEQTVSWCNTRMTWELKRKYTWFFLLKKLTAFVCPCANVPYLWTPSTHNKEVSRSRGRYLECLTDSHEASLQALDTSCLSFSTVRWNSLKTPKPFQANAGDILLFQQRQTRGQEFYAGSGHTYRRGTALFTYFTSTYQPNKESPAVKLVSLK